MRYPRSSLRPLAVVAVLLVASACQSRPTVEAVSEFSQVLESTSLAVQQGLSEVQRLETAAGDAAEAERFLREEDPNLRFGRNDNLTEALVAPRRAFFKALSSYASSLAAAVGEDQVEGVRAQFAVTGSAFAALGQRVAATSQSRFPPDLAGRVSKATAAFAAVMVDAKLDREVPKIVAAAHQDLKAGVEAFKADLGDRETGGFRSILHDLVEIRIGQQKKRLLALKAGKETSKAELYDAVLEAQSRVRKLRRAETLLDAVPAALDKLLSAHAALIKPKDPGTRAKIGIFKERAKQLWAIAEGLKP